MDVSFFDFGVFDTKLPVAHPESRMAQMNTKSIFFIISAIYSQAPNTIIAIAIILLYMACSFLEHLCKA